MRVMYAISQRIVWIITFIAMHLFARFHIEGNENLCKLPTPLLVIANHRSYWDALIIGLLFPFFSNRYLPIGFMAADELFTNPFFKAFFLLTGTYPAYKGAGLNISLKYPRSVLLRGGVVLLFPFGKLIINNNETKESPRHGAGVLVKEFPDLNILPIYVDTAPSVTFLNFIFGRKKMNVFVGKPFKVEPSLRESDTKKITIQLVGKIMALIPHERT
mgnify:CR=1 FL=1